MKAPSIAVRHLTKTFEAPDGGRNTVFSDVNLAIQQSDRVAFLGPSGVGKTSLLRIIGGLDSPDVGTVETHGGSTASPRIITITQEPNLFPWLTVEQNLLFPLRANGIPKQEAKARIQRVLESTRMVQARSLYPSELSGGMKQRASFGRGIILEPSILLLDEPFGSLDAMAREHIQEEFLEWWHLSRPTTVLVTHSVEEAVFLADKVFIFIDGPKKRLKTLDFAHASSRPISRTGGDVRDFRSSADFFERVARVREVLRNSS